MLKVEHESQLSRLNFCSYKFPASENNLFEFTKDVGAANYFFAKLVNFSFFDFFKFHQFETLSPLFFCFQIFCSKKDPLFLL